MGLKVNGGRLHTHACLSVGGQSQLIPARWVSANGRLFNLPAGWALVTGVTDKASRPEGYRHPGAWVMGRKAGTLGSRNYLQGEGDLTAAGALGLNTSATLSGSGDLNGTAALIISMVAALTGSGTLNGTAQAFLNLAATLAGSGDLTGAANALAHASAILSGSGTVVGNFAGATTGELAALITSCGGITESGIASAVWSALAVLNNNPGSMGELLNNAGAGANPWTVTLEGSYTAADILRILAAVAAGQSTIVDLGGGNATVTFKGLDLVTDRVIADMTGSERTTLTLDGN